MLELQAATSLYWDSVPVLVQSSERDRRPAQSLTIRLLKGPDRQNPALRTLRLSLSSEEDLLFLHTLEVNEEDFQTLKADQGILVDFGSFPQKVVSLLQKCLACRDEAQPRFRAVLTCQPNTSVLRVVETNDFNQLPHITLRFQPGDDVAVKQFLAFRLSETQQDLQQTSTQLAYSQERASTSQAALEEAGLQLQAAARQHESVLVSREADMRSQEASALQQQGAEVAALRDQMEKERTELRQRLDEAVAGAAAREAELEAKSRQLAEAKAGLEAKASELSCRLGMSEGSARALEDEAAHLRSVASEAARERPERLATVADLTARLRAAEERVQAQLQTMQEQTEHAKGLQADIRHLEERCAELKAASSVHESRASTLEGAGLSSTQVIDKLQGEVKALKEKLRRKTASITQLQQEVAAKEAELEAAASHVRRMTHQEQMLQDDLASSKEHLASTSAKLDEAREQIQGNEHMIRWLNTQVNEAQTQLGSTGLMTSRLTQLHAPSPRPVATLSQAHTLGRSLAATSSLFLPSSPAGATREPLPATSLHGRSGQSKSLQRILSKTRLAGDSAMRSPRAVDAAA